MKPIESLQQDLRDSLAAEQRYREQASELRALAAEPGLMVQQHLDLIRMESERLGMLRGQQAESNYLQDQIQAMQEKKAFFGRVYSGEPFVLDEKQAEGMDDMGQITRSQS
jgi:hypothetical protein